MSSMTTIESDALYAIARELNYQNRIRAIELLYKNGESVDEEEFENALRDILYELCGN